MNKENLLKELKEEILNKEFTLLDLDNTVERVTGSTTSVFDFDLDRDIINDNEGSCNYYISYNDETDMDEEINVEFTVTKENEDEKEILVKVTNVSWL